MVTSPLGKWRCDIYDIVKLKRMAHVWRKLTRGAESRTKLPSDVLPGHVAVLVGETWWRFVTRADYLNHPIFHQLLDWADEEYGHKRNGPLAIPCDEFLFQDIITSLQCGTKWNQFSCHLADKLNWRDLVHFIQGFERRSMLSAKNVL